MSLYSCSMPQIRYGIMSGITITNQHYVMLHDYEAVSTQFKLIPCLRNNSKQTNSK